MSHDPSPDRHRDEGEAQSLDQPATTRREFMIGAGAATTLSSAAKNVDLDEIVPKTPDEGGKIRHFDVHAINVDIVYNAFGQHQPNGVMCVLEDDAEAVRSGKMNPEPLVIRANVGDCVEVTFKNELESGKSVHPHFVRFDPLGSDSANVGFNYDQGADTDETMHYRWFANEEGTIFFHDHITGIPEAQNGTFAAIVVEPEDSTWHDPHTGKEIESGTQAIIEPGEGEPASSRCCITTSSR